MDLLISIYFNIFFHATFSPVLISIILRMSQFNEYNGKKTLNTFEVRSFPPEVLEYCVKLPDCSGLAGNPRDKSCSSLYSLVVYACTVQQMYSLNPGGVNLRTA